MTRSSLNWLPIVLLFIVPLVLGVTLTYAAFRLRKPWNRLVAGIAGLLYLLLLAVLVWFAPYLWARHLESKWHPADPKTKAELESFLSLYSRRDIQPSESDWGRNHQLQAGERMTQYLLLWNAPLDVVYSSNDLIVAIYTSYE